MDEEKYEFEVMLDKHILTTKLIDNGLKVVIEEKQSGLRAKTTISNIHQLDWDLFKQNLAKDSDVREEGSKGEWSLRVGHSKFELLAVDEEPSDIARRKVDREMAEVRSLVSSLKAEIDALQQQVAALKAENDARTIAVIVDGSNGSISGPSQHDISKFSIKNGVYDLHFAVPFRDTPVVTCTQLFSNRHGNPGSLLDNATVVAISNSHCRVAVGNSRGEHLNRKCCVQIYGK